MIYHIGLGSNLGKRLENLNAAENCLSLVSGLKVLKRAFTYETPALLPKAKATRRWNLPYMNTALKISYNKSPEELLTSLKNIELSMGRDSKEHWAPRIIDLDILTSEEVYEAKRLQIPHKEVTNRAFTLAPLRDLDPSGFINEKTVLELNKALQNPLPLWMGVMNLTKDSFSDGGELNSIKVIKDRFKNYAKSGVHIIDLGAESTRPGAQALPPDEEWRALAPAVEAYKEVKLNNEFSSVLSVDTRNFETALKALKSGVTILNDVSGLSDERMIDLIKGFDCQYVLMHSLSVPAVKSKHFSEDLNVVQELFNWLETKLEFLAKKGVDLNQVVFDPGLGFGKTAEQSLEILKNINEFKKLPIKTLVGHSRKSFMSIFSDHEAKDRDYESIGLSLLLAQSGVDIIRVHNPEAHIRAHKAWLHGS